jgi:steroid delta-isomerase-like uncharacterized protein
MSEQNKSLVRRLLDETWNKKNLAKLEESVSPQFAIHTPDGTVRGLNEYRQFHEAYSQAFPDCKMTIDEIIAEGDLVSVRYTFTGTHKGDLRGIAPTSKQIRLQGISLNRVSNGKVNEVFSVWDRLTMYEQLGVAPEATRQSARKAAY